MHLEVGQLSNVPVYKVTEFDAHCSINRRKKLKDLMTSIMMYSSNKVNLVKTYLCSSVWLYKSVWLCLVWKLKKKTKAYHWEGQSLLLRKSHPGI